jgi:hypothetical protein
MSMISSKNHIKGLSVGSEVYGKTSNRSLDRPTPSPSQVAMHKSTCFACSESIPVGTEQEAAVEKQNQITLTRRVFSEATTVHVWLRIVDRRPNRAIQYVTIRILIL